MIFSYPLSLVNNLGFFHFVRGFIHLTVFSLIVIYQFLFPLFIHAYLTVSLYSLCAAILFFDSLYFFFYRDNSRFNRYFHLGLILLDVCFYVGLSLVLGLAGLPLILFFMFIELVLLTLFEGWLLSLCFSFLFSNLLVLSFVWEGTLLMEDRKFLVMIVTFVLFMGFILSLFLSAFKEKFSRFLSPVSGSIDYLLSEKKPNHSNPTERSLDLSQKIRPVLNFLIKNLEDSKKNKSPAFKYYEDQLNQLHQFVRKYINYMEVDNYAFKPLHLPQFLEQILQDLKKHKDRPISLEQTLDYQSSLKWMECSSSHLREAIVNILENSFQALKNITHPKIYIQVHEQEDWLVLDFIDNGHGIEKEDQKKIFDPFFSKKLGVGGVGLAYVLKVVHAHKGEVDVQSFSDGTKISIRLPLSSCVKSKLPLIA